MMRLNHGELSSHSQIEKQKQAKIINSLGSDCPRLNTNSYWAARRIRFTESWPGAGTKISRFSSSSSSSGNKKSKHKRRRLSGFFQAQLRMIKSKQQQVKGNKLSSKKSIIASSCSTSRNCSKSKKSLINYQFGSSSCPILKRHKNMLDNQNRIHHLPKELLAEILVRLPVKYILRCRCVQKSWNSFIQSSVFISLQLNYQKKIITDDQNHHYPRYLFFQDQCSANLTLRFDHVQCQEYCKLEFLPGLPDDAWFAVSYGLICTSTILLSGSDHNRNIYLWNPLINKYKTLPDSPLPSAQNWKDSEALAFGFLPQANDYVVVHVIKPYMSPNPHSVIIGVYSLNTNSWKKLTQDNVFISTISHNHHDVVFVNGAAFWAGANSDRHRILLCFDTKTDILTEISLPDWVTFLPCVPIIHKVGQSIAYFVWETEVSHFDMWVLNYDPKNEFTWEKKMCVSLGEDVEEEVLGVRNNGEPLLAKSNNLISYDLECHQAKDFVDSWDRWTPDSPYKEGDARAPPYVVSPFVESLVLLDID